MSERKKIIWKELLLEREDNEGDFAILAITPGIIPFSVAQDLSVTPSR